MFCTKCGAQIDDKSAFCVHCGTPTSNNTQPPTPASNFTTPPPTKPIYKKWWFWLIVALVAVVIIGSAGGKAGAPSDAETTEATYPQGIKVTAKELRDAYEQNEIAAEKKYDGQLVEVTGIVDNIGTDILKDVYITLSTGKVLHSVQCYFEGDAEIDKVATLVSGQEVTVIGTCKGLTLTSVTVRDCVISNITPLGSNGNGPSTDADDNANDNLTTGQKNALKKAINYLDSMPFSYAGLIAQLEYEGYTNEEAVFAADNCRADWNEQALKDAKNYLDYSAFSYSGLIGQLEYEEYTSEQAKYAADNCGADWREQAAKCAKNYLDYSPFSRQGLIEQLEYEGFTHDQAVYGAEQNGL